MPQVICKLPNASDVINGVRFFSHKLGVISEEIDQETADGFLAINGYVDNEDAKAEAFAKAAAAKADAKAESDAAAEAAAKAESDAAAEAAAKVESDAAATPTAIKKK